jgi:hypothetical protein
LTPPLSDRHFGWWVLAGVVIELVAAWLVIRLITRWRD